MNRQQLFDLHKSLTAEALSLMEAKNTDYADDAEALGNLAMCEHLSHGNVPAELGILIRMTDKLSRLYNFYKNGKSFAVSSESFHDTALDLINYAVLLEAAASRSSVPASAGDTTRLRLTDLPPEQADYVRNHLLGSRFRSVEASGSIPSRPLHNVINHKGFVIHKNVAPHVADNIVRRLNTGAIIEEDLQCQP